MATEHGPDVLDRIDNAETMDGLEKAVSSTGSTERNGKIKAQRIVKSKQQQILTKMYSPNNGQTNAR